MNAVMQDNTSLTFDELNLLEPVLRAVKESGYETPSPIQAEMIPHMLEGKDVLGQAQTGTGKTAAFALPILSKIDVNSRALQVLVLTPTRELAMQVCESFRRYAAYLDGFQIAPIYGGKGYADQLRALRHGVQVVVGTPGRVIDHIKSGKLSLDNLSTLVLDEADEMLRMGFIDDVEWILGQAPESRQIALFSATMPRAIKHITQRYLVDPVEIVVKTKTMTAASIKQRYWMAAGLNKLDALTRILEQKSSDGVIVFVRTKSATVELADSLIARGFAAVAINGDLAQRQREQTISQLKSGRIDILVATDVAARGLDVERISHVINYDVPNDPESYVHRIGRTGRAGREGEAILFVSPREMRLISVIERTTHQRIEKMELPTIAEINAIRMQHFQNKLKEVVDQGELDLFYGILSKFQIETDCDPLLIAAALAKMYQGTKPLLIAERERSASDEGEDSAREWRGGRERRHSGPRREGGHREGGYRDGARRDSGRRERPSGGRGGESRGRFNSRPRDDRRDDRRGGERREERRDDRPMERRDEKRVERRNDSRPPITTRSSGNSRPPRDRAPRDERRGRPQRGGKRERPSRA